MDIFFGQPYTMYVIISLLLLINFGRTNAFSQHDIGSELYEIYTDSEAPICLKKILDEINSSCSGISDDVILSLAASIVHCQNSNITDCSNIVNRKQQSIIRCAISSSELHVLMLGKYTYQIEMLCEYFTYSNISTLQKLMKTGFFNESKEIWFWLKSTSLGRGILSQIFYSKDLTQSFESNRIPAYTCFIIFSLIVNYHYQTIIFLSNGFFSFIIEILLTTGLSFFDVTKPHGSYLVALLIRLIWVMRIIWQLVQQNAELFCNYFEGKKRNTRKK